MTALLTDSAMRGFAISFFTSRRVAALNATFLFFAGITPSSCHTPQGKNGQFRPSEQDSGGAFAGGRAEGLRPEIRTKTAVRYSCKKILRRELWTRISPLYSMNPSFLKRFMKKLTRDRVVPIISANVS